MPEQALLCYVQLGAGNINDIESEIFLTLDALSKHSNVYTVLGESLIGAEEESVGKEFEYFENTQTLVTSRILTLALWPAVTIRSTRPLKQVCPLFFIQI